MGIDRLPLFPFLARALRKERPDRQAGKPDGAKATAHASDTLEHARTSAAPAPAMSPKGLAVPKARGAATPAIHARPPPGDGAVASAAVAEQLDALRTLNAHFNVNGNDERASHLLASLIKQGHGAQAFATLGPFALGLLLSLREAMWPPIVRALVQLPPSEFAGLRDKAAQFPRVFEQAERLRALAPNLPIDRRDAVVTLLCQNSEKRAALPSDPLNLKHPPPLTAVQLPNGAEKLREFLTTHSLSGPPPVPATEPLPRDAMLAHVLNRISATDARLTYAIPAKAEPQRPGALFYNTTGHPLALIVEDRETGSHTFTVQPGGRLALPTSRVKAVRCDGQHLNATWNGSALEVRPDAHAHDLLITSRAGDARAPMAPGTAARQVPPIHHAIWLGGALPEKYFERIVSFKKLNPDHTQILWTDLKAEDFHKPEFAKTLSFCRENGIALVSVDATVGPALQNAGLGEFYAHHCLHRQYAAASDILRVVILEAMGGTYADADHTCMQPLHALRGQELVLPGERYGRAPQVNDFLMAQPHHPLFRNLMTAIKEYKYESVAQEQSRQQDFTREDEAVMHGTGPGALRNAFSRLSPNEREHATLLEPENYSDVDLLSAISVRSNEALWTTKRKTGRVFHADASETDEARKNRLIACVYDDFRTYGDADLGRYTQLTADPALRADVLKRVALLLANAAPQALAKAKL